MSIALHNIYLHTFARSGHTESGFCVTSPPMCRGSLLINTQQQLAFVDICLVIVYMRPAYLVYCVNVPSVHLVIVYMCPAHLVYYVHAPSVHLCQRAGGGR